MPRQRIILAVSPQKLDNGVPPDKDVDGLIGGVRFDRGVSEVVDYTTARQFAARGNATLPPGEARARVEEIRSGGTGPSGDEEPNGESEPNGDFEEAPQEKPGEGASEDVEDASSEGRRSLQLTPAALEGKSLPDGLQNGALPGYHDMLSELAEAGLSPRDFFGGQPKKEPLKKLYVAYLRDPDVLED